MQYPTTQALIQKSTVDAALRMLAEPLTLLLHSLHGRGMVKRNIFCIAIPVPPVEDPGMKDGESRTSLDLQKPVIEWLERTIGTLPSDKWPYPFKEFARAKAEMSLRVKMNNGDYLAKYPHLLQQGDIRWPGGVNFEGIVVGVSGVQSYWDQAIALMIASAIKGLATHRLEESIEGDSQDYIDYSRFAQIGH